MEPYHSWVVHSGDGMGRSTAVLEVPGGCLVLVTDKRGKADNPNLCMTFVPNCKVSDFGKLEGEEPSDTDNEGSSDMEGSGDSAAYADRSFGDISFLK